MPLGISNVLYLALDSWINYTSTLSASIDKVAIRHTPSLRVKYVSHFQSAWKIYVYNGTMLQLFAMLGAFRYCLNDGYRQKSLNTTHGGLSLRPRYVLAVSFSFAVRFAVNGIRLCGTDPSLASLDPRGIFRYTPRFVGGTITRKAHHPPSLPSGVRV